MSDLSRSLRRDIEEMNDDEVIAEIAELKKQGT
jgi:hypothetical protein